MSKKSLGVVRGLQLYNPAYACFRDTYDDAAIHIKRESIQSDSSCILQTARSDRQILRTCRTVVILIFLGFPFTSGCQKEKKHEEMHTADHFPWQFSFQAFVEKITLIAGNAKPPNAEEMHTRLDNIWALTDGAGFVIDCNPPEGTLQYETNRLCEGKRFEWTIPIHQTLWADSAHRAVMVNVSMEQYRSQAMGNQIPRWIKVKLYGPQSLPTGNVLRVSGVLGKPGMVSGECQLASVCVVYFPDNIENEYGLLIVLEGVWSKYGE